MNDLNSSMISSVGNVSAINYDAAPAKLYDAGPSKLDRYNYNRPNVDNRFKVLSSSETLDDDMSDAPPSRPLTLNKAIASYDRKLLEYIVTMHNILRSDYIKVDDFASVTDALLHYKSEQELEYLVTLVHPEKAKGSKIPSTIPVPSSSFQMHNSVTVTTNALGNACLVFNPFFLATSGTNSTFYVNNNAGLTGSSSSNFFTATNIGQTIPNVYNEYRLVSASIVVKYVGRLDIVQGVIGGAIVFDQNVGASDFSTNTINANLAKYGDFNLAMDAYYTQENVTLNGIRELFFPLDTTFEQYFPTGQTKTGFAQVIYILGAVPSSASYKVDIYCNFECLPDATFLNYIPTTLGAPCSAEKKQEAIAYVQKEPITSDSRKTQPYGFWDNVKNRLGNLLPSVAQIATNYLGMAVPGLKPLMGVAGSLFQQQNNQKYLV